MTQNESSHNTGSKPSYAEVAKTAPEDMDDLYEKVVMEDGDWEDEDGSFDERIQRHSLTTSGTASGRSTPRRRRKGTRLLSTKDTKQNGTSKLFRRARSEDDQPMILKEDVVYGTLRGAVFTSKYVLDVLGRAFQLLRIPLSFLLFLWILSFLLSSISSKVHSAMRPLCYIPGFHRMPICHYQPIQSTGRKSKRADYPGLVDVQSKTFEQLMGSTTGGSVLSLEIKRAEMATSDLVALVHVSDLKARKALATSLTDFVNDAKKTGRGLQKLSAKVGGAVDNIMAVNDYALASIEDARAKQLHPWSINALMPWAPSRENLKEIVTKTFDEAMEVLSLNMNRLILEAEVNLQNLNNLEERLATIHDIITREDKTIKADKDELLGLLWTRLGLNSKKIKNFDDHLALLTAMTDYRKDARAHVVAALQTLNAMSEDMEDLRERVAAPELLGSNVPVEVHMKSIKMGLERMKEGRLQAKRIEQETMKRVLGGDGPDDDE